MTTRPACRYLGRFVAMAAAALLLQAAACESHPAAQAEKLPPGVTKARVVSVVDGDTVDVKALAGARLPGTRVRFIGVDKPETTRAVEPYGHEATAFTHKGLLGKTVYLEKDVSETDRYGRALRYVWLTSPPAKPTEEQVRKHLFNAILVLGGYAQVATHPPDVKYAELPVKFQREAREAGRELWGVEGDGGDRPTDASGGKPCDPSYPDVCIPPPPPDLDCRDIPLPEVPSAAARPASL